MEDSSSFLLSQSASQSQIPRSQVRNPNTEFFKQTVRKSGIILSSGSPPNVVTQEQAIVVRELENNFNAVAESPAMEIEQFVKGFKVLIKKEKYFKKALLPTVFKKDARSTDNLDSDVGESISVPQESLFRLFLKINQLQETMIEILLDEITNNSEEKLDTSYIRLLLSQLRYLPNIKNGASLTCKLLDILEVSSFPCQHEILDSIPEIIPDSEYHQTAQQLCKMLDNNDDLSIPIIDCLNALNLEQSVRNEVQDHILSKILVGTKLKTFPVLLEFLLTDIKTQNIQTFIKLRNALDSIMGFSDKANKEKESGKIVVLTRLQALSTRKTVSEAWLNLISSIKQNADHKPVDLLILVMLHSNAKNKKRSVETLVRKKVKCGLFKCALIELFFAKYLPIQIPRDYLTSMIEIGCTLLRTSSDSAIIEFTTTFFKLLFICEHTETIDRQEILDNLILLTGASDHKNIPAVLNIFTVLLEDITRMQQHTLLLMRLLEKVDSFELTDVKQVFEILCGLTCSDESLSDLKQEIHMIIRKQLSSTKRMIKLRGIISTVVMAKHLATTLEDQSEICLSEDSFLTISNLENGAKEAAGILELAKRATLNNPELLGLYYDQLASILVTSVHLDKSFIAWLYEIVTNDFQNVFVTDSVCANMNELEFAMQYNLNSSEEMETPLGVNIAELTLKPDTSCSITLLSPHFRLLRLLHYRQQHGDLSTIDALLGCSVILPKTDLIDSLDSQQLELVADCVFHCINWFRETISGFVTQKSRKLRFKVVQRLGNMIELEKLLCEILESIPQHKLPISYFDALSDTTKQSHSVVSRNFDKPSKGPRKKQKVAANDTSVMATAASTSKSTKNTNTKTKKPSVSEMQVIVFREVDTDIIRLLKYPLEKDLQTQSSDQTSLSICQLNFILKDFGTKLKSLTTNRNLGLSHLNVVKPIDLIKDCVQILPNVNKHFASINKKLSELVEGADGVQDSLEMFSEEIIEFKIGFGLVIEILAAIFSWSGFQQSQRLDILRDILRTFRRPESTQTLHSANRLTVDLVETMSNYQDHCFVMSHGVNLIRLMEALYQIAPVQEIRSRIAKTSSKLLNKRWCTLKGSAEIGKGCAVNLDVLIKSYLSSASIKTLNGLVGTLQEQVPALKSKEDNLIMLTSVDKQNFYILYRNLWDHLLDRIKIEITSLTNNQHLVLWKTTALTMQGLMMVVKSQETKSNLVCFLKKSIAILKVFLSDGIPIMEIMLKSKSDQVVEIFKTIQTTTRFLHHLCCYTKLHKDAGLMNYVPQFRLTLETLVYRVKAALVANGCSAAFWMGNLKNRDLQGEDILSQTQSTEASTSGNDDADEELPEDDSSGEEENRTNADETHHDSSGSDIF